MKVENKLGYLYLERWTRVGPIKKMSRVLSQTTSYMR